MCRDFLAAPASAKTVRQSFSFEAHVRSHPRPQPFWDPTVGSAWTKPVDDVARTAGSHFCASGQKVTPMCEFAETGNVKLK